MIAKNLIITFLGFLVALTAYFNVQSGIKEPFLGLSGITAGTHNHKELDVIGRGQEVPSHRHPYPMSNNTHTVRGIGPAPTHKRAVSKILELVIDRQHTSHHHLLYQVHINQMFHHDFNPSHILQVLITILQLKNIWVYQ